MPPGGRGRVEAVVAVEEKKLLMRMLMKPRRRIWSGAGCGLLVWKVRFLVARLLCLLILGWSEAEEVDAAVALPEC